MARFKVDLQVNDLGKARDAMMMIAQQVNKGFKKGDGWSYVETEEPVETQEPEAKTQASETPIEPPKSEGKEPWNRKKQ